MRIGIITQYYHSHNYGGNLQAYALCKYLCEQKYDVEQISYDWSSKRKSKDAKPALIVIIKNAYHEIKNLPLFFKRKRALKCIAQREESVLRFNQKIPHSETVYTEDTIVETNSFYDVFIVGSDLVWLPRSLGTGFFLNFAEDKKRKISYAASIGVDSLNDEQKNSYKRNLYKFDAISVREIKSVDLLNDCVTAPIINVLDPVFLLNPEHWFDICTERKHTNPYLFCYLLGSDEKIRNMITEYANKKGLTIITMPYLEDYYRKCDENFGHIRVFDATPNDFLSYIRYADMVFTDSFHVVAFSLIFEKEFFAVQRDGLSTIGTRIDSITTLTGTKERYIVAEDTNSIEYIQSLSVINYTEVKAKIEKLKTESISFLNDSLTTE